jgi:hypothetical protein
MDSATSQINNIMLAAVPTANYQGTLNDLKPLEANRDMVVSSLASDFTNITNQMLQTKDQVDSVNSTNRFLKQARTKNDHITSEIESKKKELQASNAELQKQLARQKIVIDMFWVFGITIIIYILFRGTSYVHILATIVLLAGFVYVILYNAYRLHISSTSNPSASATVPSLFPDVSNVWNSGTTGVQNLASGSVSSIPSLDTSKWTSTIPGQS